MHAESAELAAKEARIGELTRILDNWLTVPRFYDLSHPDCDDRKCVCLDSDQYLWQMNDTEKALAQPAEARIGELEKVLEKMSQTLREWASFASRTWSERELMNSMADAAGAAIAKSQTEASK